MSEAICPKCNAAPPVLTFAFLEEEKPRTSIGPCADFGCPFRTREPSLADVMDELRSIRALLEKPKTPWVTYSFGMMSPEEAQAVRDISPTSTASGSAAP